MTIPDAIFWTILALLALPILCRVGWLAVRVLFAAFLFSAALLLAAHELRLAVIPLSEAAVCLAAMRWRSVWRLCMRARARPGYRRVA